MTPRQWTETMQEVEYCKERGFIPGGLKLASKWAKPLMEKLRKRGVVWFAEPLKESEIDRILTHRRDA